MNMKNVTITLFLAIVAYSISAQTTQEEYNYVTKGYKVQLESGLDMKKGYTLKDLFETSTQTGPVTRTTTFKGLYKTGSNNPCAIMMIYKREGTAFTEYICIPHYASAQSIWDQYFQQLAVLDTVIAAKTAAYGIARCAAYFSQNN